MTQAVLPTDLRFPFDLIKEGLLEVESVIQAQASQFEAGVEAYVSYVCGASGKRIRPALALLSGMATGGEKKAHVSLGVVLELIHMASLVHDDIMDGADVRRGLPTASHKWGNSLSVLVGDAMFAHALELATEFDEVRICRRIAKASKDVCSGEILQTQRRFDLSLSVEEYLKILEMKTAALFEVATELGAVLNQSPETWVTGLGEYGRKLGIAYQIYDDCVDLVGDERKIGKTLGTDLQKGKLTLPILNLIAQVDKTQKEKLNTLLIEREPIDLEVLTGMADYGVALESAVSYSRSLVQEAREDLKSLPESEARLALDQVGIYLDTLLQDCKI